MKWQAVLDSVKKNLELIKIDKKKIQVLEENNKNKNEEIKQQKLQIQRQEEKVAGLNIKIGESKKKISSLKKENSSQEYVEYYGYAAYHMLYSGNPPNLKSLY